jgi:peroxiredoxin (alkyl hydroperoxide reductase subunit C)
MELLVGNKAPNFKATAVLKNQMIENFSLEDFAGENIVFFFYPLDFTFVCPTELHAFQDKIDEFKKRNTKVIGCSIDSQYSHAAWLNTPKSSGGIEGISYPIVSDITKKISKEFGVLNEKIGIAYRGLFIIDTKGIIRHQLINDLLLPYRQYMYRQMI